MITISSSVYHQHTITIERNTIIQWTQVRLMCVISITLFSIAVDIVFIDVFNFISGILWSFVYQHPCIKTISIILNKDISAFSCAANIFFFSGCTFAKTKTKYKHNDNIIWHSLKWIDKWSLSVRNKYPTIEEKQIASISSIAFSLPCLWLEFAF